MSRDPRKEMETLTKDQTIEQQRAIIEKLKTSNEKLQRKLEYYENFLENVAQFEKSQNILNMKAFTKSVYPLFFHSFLTEPTRTCRNLIVLLRNTIKARRS